jgi:Kdo2-lipid IVA lauroyltransferase/acyltransferase
MQHIGATIGRWAALLPGRYGQRLRTNMQRAYPNATEEDFRQAAAHAGQMAAELPYLWHRSTPTEAVQRIDCPHFPLLEVLLAQGRGLMVLTPHLGCFELIAQFMAAQGPFTALYRPPHDSRLHDWIVHMRKRHNLELAAADASGVRKLVKALRRGEAIGILPDQVPSAGEGVWADFFGQPAYTMSLAQRLHHLNQAPIAMLACERLAAGQYRLHIHPLDPLPENPEAAARAINAGLERLIELAPKQYLWGYNRYKQPAGAPPIPRQE